MTVPRAPFLLLVLACGCADPYAETLDALRRGDASTAVTTSRGTEWEAFVRGNDAFARSEAAEQLDLQIALAENAVAAWRAAAMRRDWPEARRNVERGLLRLEGLFNPLLLTLGTRVVPCNLALERHDMTTLITGPNSGGKTRLLQSLGLTQILAQSGAFIPARSGSVALCSALVVSLIQETKADQAEG